MQQATSQFENTVEVSLTEVEIAVREVATTYREMLGKYHAMLAAADETFYLSDRYALLPGINDSAVLLLEDLLDAQERQADEEAAFVDAQVSYSVSLIRLRKAMGTLLLTDPVGSQLDRQQRSSPQLPAWEQREPPRAYGTQPPISREGAPTAGRRGKRFSDRGPKSTEMVIVRYILLTGAWVDRGFPPQLNTG